MKNILLEKYSDKFVSRWLILLLDLVIASMSCLMAYSLRYTFHFDNFSVAHYIAPFLYILAVRGVVFLYFQSYSGIIRHTSVEDAAILLKAVAVGTVLIKGIEMLIFRNIQPDNPFYIQSPILIIDFFICLALLTGSRFLVKFVYDGMSAQMQNQIPVLIYGAGNSGIATKKVLQSDKSNNYNLIGFIDDNPSMINKTMEGVKVYTFDEIEKKILDNKSKKLEVILAIQSLSLERKTEIIDYFLNKGVVIKTVPTAQTWVNGEFQANQIHTIKIEDLLERPTIKMNTPKIQKELTGKVIMVSGAAGSIGSEIVRQLIRFAPEKIILIDQGESALYDLEFEIRNSFKDYIKQTEINIVIANVNDEFRLRRIFRNNRPNMVFHAAAYKHVPMMENNPYEAVKVNVLGTKNVADLSVEFDVEKFVLVSTDKAVNPTNVMGATKRLAEMYTQSMNGLGTTKFITTRFGNVLGSSGSVIPLFKKQIQAGGPITVTHPDIIRYFMTIPEASQLVLEAGAMGLGGEVFVFDMGQPVKVVDLAKKMIQLSGLTLEKDIEIQYTGLRPGEKLYEELLNDNENCSPTHHPKIMKGNVITKPFIEMEIIMSNIEKELLSGNNNDLIKILKRFVPEFISNNSVYEKLDMKTLS